MQLYAVHVQICMHSLTSRPTLSGLCLPSFGTLTQFRNSEQASAWSYLLSPKACTKLLHNWLAAFCHPSQTCADCCFLQVLNTGSNEGKVLDIIMSVPSGYFTSAEYTYRGRNADMCMRGRGHTRCAFHISEMFQQHHLFANLRTYLLVTRVL